MWRGGGGGGRGKERTSRGSPLDSAVCYLKRWGRKREHEGAHLWTPPCVVGGGEGRTLRGSPLDYAVCYVELGLSGHDVAVAGSIRTC